MALAAVALVGWTVRRAWAGTASLTPGRRATLTGLRVATLGSVLLVLMRPVAVGPRPHARDTRVAVLVDGSRSMHLRDAGNQTRLDAARALVEEQLLPVLSEAAIAEVSSFGGANEPPTPGDAIRAAARAGERAPLGSVVIVSDGAVDLGPRPDPAVAVFAVGVGGTGEYVDREVVDATLGDPTITDSNVPLTATLASRGVPTPVEVRLLEEDRVIAVRTLAPPAGGGLLRTVFRVSPRRDRPTVYTVEIPATPGELTPANNAVRVLAPPPGRPRRVLMVEGAPGFEHSFLKRAWLADPGVRLDAVVRKGRNEGGEPTFYVQAPLADLEVLASGLPATVAALFAYDAVVLANAAPDELTTPQLDMLRRFVAERGGGLLAFGARLFEPRGLAGTPLESMLPVGLPGDGADEVVRTVARAGASGVAATRDGIGHPVMQLGDDPASRWSELPALSSVSRMGGPHPGAAVLAVGDAPGGGVRPLVAVQRYGMGRVLVFLGEASWRWKMQLPAADTRYDTFWRQALRWVAAGAPGAVSVELENPADPSHVVVGVSDDRFTPTADARVLVTTVRPASAAEGRGASLNGTEQAATIRDAAGGVFEARLPPFPLGVPVLIEAVARQGDREIGRGELWVLDGASDREMADPRRNDLALARLAQAGGGRLLSPTDLLEASRWLPPPATPDAGAAGAERAGLEERDLWHHPAVFLVIVSALATEWALRRRWGLS